MASTNKRQLLQGNFASNKDGDKTSVELRDFDFIAVLVITNWVAGNFACKIQHSADGINWVDLESFAALAADGFEYKEISAKVLPNVRGVIAVAGGDADVEISLYHDQRK